MFSVIFHIHNCFPRAVLIIKREHITTEIKAERSKWKQDMLQRLVVEASSSSCPVEATGGVQSLLELVASSMTSPPGIREIASIATPPCRTKTNRRVYSSKES